MYEIPRNDQSPNKENRTLRAFVGDPNRYTPLAEHRSPSTMSSQEKPRSSMYTLETRYQPIPSKVLPKKTEPRVYYVGSRNREESPFTNDNREGPLPIRPGQQSTTPTIFLEPKVVAQPIIYSIVSSKITPRVDQPISINREPPSPIIYSISNHPHRPTVDMSTNNSEVRTPIIDKSATLYSLVNSPRYENPIHEPTKQYLQPTPNLYSIVGTSARTSRGVQVSPPTPIVYTVVNDTPAPTNKPSPPITSKKQSRDVSTYTLDNDANVYHTQQPIKKPTLYTLVDRPYSPPEENYARLPARQKTPPPPQPITPIPTRRVSRSLERKPETINEEIVMYPIRKTKHQSKEPTIPKPELITISHNDDEGRSHPKPHTITQYPPIQLSDYHSPYGNRTTKPYRERKYNNDPLPIISHTQSERKPRPPLHEPRYRNDRPNPNIPTKSTSSERYPVSTKPHRDMWTNGYQTQTDDDEDNEQKINKKRRYYQTPRPRAPWIPVW